jgi:hypothetical protein
MGAAAASVAIAREGADVGITEGCARTAIESDATELVSPTAMPPEALAGVLAYEGL